MRRIDITDQVFGRLRVVRKAPEPCMWECVCSCGTVRLFTGTNLRTGNTTSCGCAHKEQLAERNRVLLTLDPWLADMQMYVRKLGYRKNRRKTSKLGANQFKAAPSDAPEHPTVQFPWGLSLADYQKLVTSSCFYCGGLPNQLPQGVSTRALGLRRNGIDRVDNSKGYEPKNCVPCCAPCNREKRAQTQAEFIENTCRRYEHLKAKGLL
jgi:hypothetical protein